jgi:hypothetical protein
VLLTRAQAAEQFFHLQNGFEAALRGQSPDGSEPPLPNGFSPGTGIYNPFSPPPAAPQDPFMAPPLDIAPLVCGPTCICPATFLQPYRYGWTPRIDLGYLPSSHTGPNVGNFSDFELDSELVFAAPVGPDLVFTFASQFNYRHWDATAAFTKDLFRFGYKFQLSTPAPAPWGYQITFNPSLNTDFGAELASESVNLDANGSIYYRLDPVWTFVLGVGYLDRVHDIVVPHAGVVITPDDLWEFRLLFPQGQISRFVGNFWWGSHWLYVGWEFHVESYQVRFPGNSREQVQLEDYRLTLGLRSDHPGFTKYIEAGYIFGRNVDFKRALPGFDISDGFMVRGGIRF